jgi:hypothetical protein
MLMGSHMAQVVVLEKGHYIRAAELPLLEKHAMGNMYERGGTLSTTDLGMLHSSEVEDVVNRLDQDNTETSNLVACFRTWS